MKNMEIWDKLRTPPKTALKKITGGRLKGMTDIKPQWRYRAMTEQFGPCGEGWSYTIDKLWTEAGTDGQVFVFALVSVTVNGCKPIQGCGGSMLIEKQKSGLHHNDEAYKMAITDALSTSLKMLGVGADVYENITESKYNTRSESSNGRTTGFEPVNGGSTPPSETKKKLTSEDIKYFQSMTEQKKRLGEAIYYETLAQCGFGHCNEATTREQRVSLYNVMIAR